MASKLQRVRFCLCYDGTDFFGWQKQPKHSHTVQGVLEERLSKIFDQEVKVVGSGRTDRGVHAINQWAHADLPNDKRLKNLHYSLNRLTPASISIKKVELAPSDFHAQISAVEKRYVYRMFCRERANPFLLRYSWHFRDELNLKFLQEASELLLGEHDFSSFQSQGTTVSSTRRRLNLCRWVPRDSGFVDFHIRGNGFLKQMVRNIVGTLMWYHEKGLPPQAISQLLRAEDRSEAGPPAPPQGLFLASVRYPQSLDIKCRKL
ncbi:MAG: tRNA pseudouridine(38-40) synthase TruA [Bdellovibrionales bacterium]|nr:tRNA pseudouridine(38-40) synthase TruA [Bdellovibrionales bacterium]